MNYRPIIIWNETIKESKNLSGDIRIQVGYKQSTSAFAAHSVSIINCMTSCGRLRIWFNCHNSWVVSVASKNNVAETINESSSPL